MHKVTIEIDKYKKQLIVQVDDELWQQGHISILGSKPALPEECESLDDLEKIYQSLEYRGAKRLAYKRLSAKNMPSFELDRLLEEKYVSETNRHRIVTELQQLGYMNDAQWAESFVRQQANRKNGPRMISQKLKAKGYDSDATADLMEKMQPEELQKEAIKKLLTTRYRSRDLNDRYERDKVVAALARKGFSIQIILETIKNETCQ